MWYSTDGIAWSAGTGLPFGTGQGLGVIYSDALWIAAGDDGATTSNIWYSTNGIAWTAGTGAPFGTGNAHSIRSGFTS